MMASEIEALPDRAGFVKFASGRRGTSQIRLLRREATS